MSSEESLKSEKPSFGNQLKEARQRRGMSDADLAKKTHLSLALIQSLEREEAHVVRRVGYVRGYIRSCAKVLEVDPNPILDAYNQQFGRDPVEQDNIEPLLMPVPLLEQKKKKIIWLTGVITLLLLVVSYLYFEPEVQLPTSLSVLEGYRLPEEEALPLVHDLEPVVEAVTKDALQPIAIEIEVDASPLMAEPEIVVSLPPVEPLEANSNDLEEVIRANLELNIHLRCWIKIVDARDRILLHDLYEPRQTRRISGIQPFDVVLGNASGIDLKVNNQNYDFSRYIRRDRSAHFTIRNPDR